MWRADHLGELLLHRKEDNFNPLAPRGARHRRLCLLPLGRGISIHSLRVGARLKKQAAKKFLSTFQSTRSAWERDFRGRPNRALPNSFQSTRSAWERDPADMGHIPTARYFNPLAPRGSETQQIWVISQPLDISIHSLRVGARPPTWPATAAPMGNFNPLAPRGSETANTYKKAGILSPQQYNFHKQLSNYKAYFSFPSLFLHSATQFFGAKVPGKQCVLGVRTKSSPPQKGADCRVEARTNGGAIRRRSSGWTGAGRRRRRTP